ncbi:MAG: energy transducer TonB [Deltaproteobacteria bacterium]|nr:energy transducer TonB [Deltaproteobacteria bacterium]
MKKYIFFATIVAVIFFSFILYASENEDSYHPEIDRFASDTPPVVIKQVNPSYPWKAMRELIEGVVIVKFIVNKEGNIEDPIIEESVPLGYFEDAAIEAIYKYQFKPATGNGVPVDCIANLPVIFAFGDLHARELSIRLEAYRAWDYGVTLLEKAEYLKSN